MSVPGSTLLQMLRNGINTAVDRTGPGPSPYLGPEEQAAADRARRASMTASLFRSAAPTQRGTTNLLGDIGNALAAGQAAQGQSVDQAMKARLVAAQMSHYNQQPQQPKIGDPSPEKFTPESLRAYMQSGGDPGVLRANQPAPAVKIGDPSPNDFTPESLRNYIQSGGDPSVLKPIQTVELSELDKKIATLEKNLGRKLSPQEVLTISGGGSLFDAKTDEADKPISPTDLNRLRKPDGSQFPYGTTGKQAMAAGAMSYSEADLTKQANRANALNTFSRLKEIALGPTGVFRDNGGSPMTNNFLARMANGISNGMGNMFGTAASIQRDLFNKESQGLISSLVRSLGEAGSLSDGDVKRALALLPVLGSMPATEALASAQFAELESIIRGGAQGLGMPGGANSGDKADPLGIR